jgi:4-hydroxy-tetrahydrodipicolinate reductase
MDPLRICISGALGAVGRQLVKGVHDAPDLVLASAVARRGVGTDVGGGVKITDDLATALDAGVDVVVDYTHPSVIRQHIALAFERGIGIVIGTTGLADADFEEVDAAARAAGVGAATGNMAITAALLQHLGKIAAAHIPHWEVIEYGAASKPDVPSGTARELAELMGRIQTPVVELGRDELFGPVEARGATFGGAHVHSIRLPGSSPSVEVVFGLPGQRLRISYDMQSDSSIFVDGSLLAARRIHGHVGLVRGLDSLLFA